MNFYVAFYYCSSLYSEQNELALLENTAAIIALFSFLYNFFVFPAFNLEF